MENLHVDQKGTERHKWVCVDLKAVLPICVRKGSSKEGHEPRTCTVQRALNETKLRKATLDSKI